MNSITICGRIGRDPELKYTPSGVPVCGFSVAEDHKRGDKEWTVWFSCSAFGEMAERINQWFGQGKPILVRGKVTEVRGYAKRDGTPGASLEVQVEGFEFVPFGGKREGAVAEPETPMPPAAPTTSAAETGPPEMPDITDPFADQ